MSRQQQYKKKPTEKNSFQVEKLHDVALKAAKHTFNTFLTTTMTTKTITDKLWRRGGAF